MIANEGQVFLAKRTASLSLNTERVFQRQIAEAINEVRLRHSLLQVFRDGAIPVVGIVEFHLVGKTANISCAKCGSAQKRTVFPASIIAPRSGGAVRAPGHRAALGFGR